MHVYDSDDLRLLSAALSEALGLVQKSADGPLAETETASFSERLAANAAVSESAMALRPGGPYTFDLEPRSTQPLLVPADPVAPRLQ
jgi:hypothetical protein